MVINEHRCVQAQILVASIVDVGVGAQVRLSLLIFIFGTVPGFPGHMVGVASSCLQ